MRRVYGWALGILLSLAAMQAGAQDTIFPRMVYKLTNGKVTVLACSPRYRIGTFGMFFVKRTQVSEIDRPVQATNEGTCFSATFVHRDELQNGDAVDIYHDSFETVTITVSGIPSGPTPNPTPRPGPTPRPSPTPAPTPRPTATPQPTPQPPADVDLRQVRSTAINSARFFANRVVNLYAQTEAARFSLWRGMKDAERLHNGLGGTVDRLPDYSEGLRAGDAQGRQNGYVAGLNDGSQLGSQLGQAQAIERFEAAVDRPAELNTEVRVPTIPYAGMESTLPSPRAVGQRLIQSEGDLQQLLRRTLNFDHDIRVPSDIYVRYWSLPELFLWSSYRSDLTYRYPEPENAFRMWRNEELSSNNRSNVEYYDRVSNPNRAGNAREAESEFRRTFIREYSRDVADKWDEALRANNQTLYSRGQDYFMQSLRGYARDLGYKQAYDQQFRLSSITGFSERFELAYRDTFLRITDQHRVSAVVVGLKANIMTERADRVFALLDPIHAVISEGRNRGMLDASLEISADGLGIVPPSVRPILQLSSLTSIKHDAPVQIIEPVGFVSPNLKPKKEVTSRLLIGSTPVAVTFTVDWQASIRKLAAASPSVTREQLVEAFRKILADEYKELSGPFGTVFDQDNTMTLIEDFSQIYVVLSPQEQQALRAYRDQFKSTYGPRPSWLSNSRDDWDAIMKIFARMGW